MKKGIYTWFGYPLNFEERIRLIKKAGFDTVMLSWADDNIELNGPKEQQPKIVRSYGLEIENAHLPYARINTLWNEGIEGDVLEEQLKNAIKECQQYGIKRVIMHITSGFKLPPLGNVMIDRVTRIAEIAEQCGISVALENLKVIEALYFLLDNIPNENVGFCFDSGHYNCFARDIDLLGKYGQRLIAVHLHDNFSETDQHMLPYDGNADWHKIVEGIRNSVYKGSLTLELEASKHENYSQMSAEEYLQEAFRRIQRLNCEITGSNNND